MTVSRVCGGRSSGNFQIVTRFLDCAGQHSLRKCAEEIGPLRPESSISRLAGRPICEEEFLALARKSESLNAFIAAEGPPIKVLLPTTELEFVRILRAAGDKTFTCDFVTRCGEHHIQRYVKRLDDGCSKHVLKPSSLNKTRKRARNDRQNVRKGEIMKRQYVSIVMALVGFPQFGRAGTQYSFLANG
jgi:hypothetical protein